MADELLILQEKPAAEYLIAGWRRQWANGGRISSGLPRYLIENWAMLNPKNYKGSWISWERQTRKPSKLLITSGQTTASRPLSNRWS